MLYDVVLHDLMFREKVQVEAASPKDAAEIALSGGTDRWSLYAAVEERHTTETFQIQGPKIIRLGFLSETRNVLHYYQDGAYEGRVIDTIDRASKYVSSETLPPRLVGVSLVDYSSAIIATLEPDEIFLKGGRFKNFSTSELPIVVEKTYADHVEKGAAMIDFLGSSGIVWSCRAKSKALETTSFRYSFTNTGDAVNFKLRF